MLIDPSQIAPGYSSKVIGGKDTDLTFVGVLRKYFYGEEKGKYVCEGWEGRRTIPEYINDYEKRLIPCLPVNKRLADYTIEDYEHTIVRFQKSHPENDESTLNHYKWLFRRVYSVGVANQEYVDALLLDARDSNASAVAEGSEEKIKATKLIKKSFSAEQEMRLAQWFQNLDPRTATGEDIGLFIMFCNGLRGNEACGLNFADIHIQAAENPFPCIYITKTTEVDSNRLKAGAKTSNGIRVVPTFDFLMGFIKKRREHILNLARRGIIELPGDEDKVQQLPIVCRGEDYLTRASSRDLTRAGNELFEKLGISDRSRDIALQETLYKTKLAEYDIAQREITTYLFRRNAATFYYLLGFAPDLCEYLMGHEIVDGERRSFYVNQDVLYKIYCRLKNHPLNCLWKNFYEKFLKCNTTHLIKEKIRVIADEPGQSIGVRMVAGSSLKIICCSSNRSSGARGTVDCSKIVQEVYLGKVKN